MRYISYTYADNVALFYNNNNRKKAKKKYRFSVSNSKEERMENGYKFYLRSPETGYRLKSLLLLFSYSAELIGLSSWN